MIPQISVETKPKRTMSLEHREKIRRANLGKKLSEETKEKCRRAHLGKKLSEQTKEKCRQAHLGKKMSVVSREKMRKARTGKIMPEHIKEAIRTTIFKKGINIPVIIDKKYYPSLTAAAKAEGTTAATVHRRCKSLNWMSWKLAH